MNVHFGKWDDLLTLAQPSSDHVFQTIIYHFGKGMAHAAKKQITEAKASSVALDALLGEQELTIPVGPFSAPVQPSNVASELLKGFIAINENDIAQAIAHFSKASSIEDKMIYNEPRDWLLNSRQYEGTAYLLDKQWANAEKAFRTDLKRNAQNSWSLNGLVQALKSQKKSAEAKLLEEKLKKSIAKGDLQLSKLSFD
jgi:tetratricopeptide (TPR) repeat protein